jgi:hypothetical protein
MSNTLITESEVKQFIHDWFHKLNIHPPVEEVLPLVANEKLLMKMPEGEFKRHEGFKKWYEGANKFYNQVHTIKGLTITLAQDTAKVEVVLQWQRNAPDESGRAGFYAAQTWELERSPQTQRLFIVMYNVDYFVSEVASDDL